jgi:mannose-1-phosphate guanylyltransferase/mannose-1-phosphate guanylyltransferase/mannose-6-phosphate isomerase
MNSENNIWSVVMAGGSGSRLWPLSRTSMPKQFCSINGKENLFYQTIRRASQLSGSKPLIVIINKEYKFLAIQELDKLGFEYHLILEPEKKNTAPAISIACRYALNFDDKAQMVVLSSDHYISSQEDFSSTIADTLQSADYESIITFGAKALTPETGYGYIHYEKKDTRICNINSFVEKPSKEKAKEYVKNGCYLWNTGIFLFSAHTMLNELKIYAREVYDISKEISLLLDFNDNIHELDANVFRSFTNISIDYAVLENTKIAKVAMIDFEWSDLGTWSSIWKNGTEKDSDNNFAIGNINLIDTKNSLILSNDKHISALGMENTIIVDTPDALFISSMDSVDKISECVKSVKEKSPLLVSENRKVFRPWGWYDSIDRDSSHQVKRIHVYPGQKLSVQRHQHRAERWIIIKGVATVTLDKEDFEFKVGEVVQIKIMQIHSLANYTEDALEIIEVQLGDYLGEDDIERFEDIYGRA